MFSGLFAVASLERCRNVFRGPRCVVRELNADHGGVRHERLFKGSVGADEQEVDRPSGIFGVLQEFAGVACDRGPFSELCGECALIHSSCRVVAKLNLEQEDWW